MEDTPVLKWTLAALGVIVVFFCLGYFVLGPTPKQQHPQPANGTQIVEQTDGNTSGTARTRPRPSAKPGLILEDQTSEIQAKMKKLEEEKQRAEEARKKAEEALRLKELAALASPSPLPTEEPIGESPSPETSPTPEETQPDNQDNIAVTTPPPPITPEPKIATPEPRTVTLKPIVARAPIAPKPAPTPEPTKPPASTVYKVQVGPYSTREAANTMAAELRGRGFSTLIVNEESGSKATFRVQVGAFKSKASADSSAKELQANGYDAQISE